MEATTALETANRLIRAPDRQFDLLCVAPRLPRKPDAHPHKHEYERRALREITQILERSLRSITPKETVRLVKEIGSPSASIVSRTGDYDVTVIGPQGRGTAANVGLGPVASRVVEHARGAILVARKLRSEEGLRILVAVDGSAAGFHAIETLGEVIDIAAADICLMHVAETPWTELGLEEDWVTWSEEDKEHSEAGILEHEMVREGESLLEQARDLLLPFRASIGKRLDEGDPANEILSEAERGGYDLIVLGATGARDLKHQMLGSVSAKVAWNAPCSVLIVREPE